MEQMNELSLRGFTAALSEKTSVPGGGGASALAAALGAALGGMVCAYTVGSPKYAAVDGDVRRILAACETLREQALACIDADAEAFAPLAQAYRIPKDDPSRAETLERCLHAAAQPPMEVLRLCCRAIGLHAQLLEKGSAMLLSDVGTGTALCRGALCGAALNVRVNTRLMTDRAFADAINAEVDECMAHYGQLAELICEQVAERLR